MCMNSLASKNLFIMLTNGYSLIFAGDELKKYASFLSEKEYLVISLSTIEDMAKLVGTSVKYLFFFDQKSCQEYLDGSVK